jgi:hypothetical protein
MMQYSEDLLGRQNADGGWSYHRGGSWTEPTCYAILALAANGASHTSEVRRGVEWLRRCQRPDGGVAPRESVPESTWLTALTLLLPSENDGVGPGIDRHRAETWTIAQTGHESGWVNRLRLWMLGMDSADSISFDGWPWYPGTAAWVGPTAVSILALEKLQNSGGQADTSALRKRIQEGRSFLLARRCRDGGWNHGSTRALGYDSDSYPETTGMALLALRGTTGPEITQGLVRGEQHLAECQSSEASSWLRLGLRAHGHPKPAVDGTPLPMHGGVMEIALAALADAAQEGRNPFFDV